MTLSALSFVCVDIQAARPLWERHSEHALPSEEGGFHHLEDTPWFIHAARLGQTGTAFRKMGGGGDWIGSFKKELGGSKGWTVHPSGKENSMPDSPKEENRNVQ